MAIDRAKLTKSAQKHLAKGNLDRAIADYEQLAQDDPTDARTLLKLGDVYAKQGAMREASATYRKVASQYAEHGFFLKAVAVLKQILKLDPSQIDVWENLAEMYELLSLTSDAIATFEQVADAYTQAGKQYKALGPLGKLEELDPENVAACVRYAEALSKARRIDDAVEAFQRGVDTLKRQGRTEDYLKVAERLLFHQTDNHALGRELAQIYLDRSEPKRALARLQACFKADPKNVQTLTLLARSFELLGQTSKTISVHREVARIEADAGNLEGQATAVRAILALDANDADAQNTLRSIQSSTGADPSIPTIDLDDDEEEELVILDDEDDSGVVSLTDSDARPMPSASPSEGTEEVLSQASRLMAECEVFVRYGLHEKVEAQLKTVLALLPDHTEARIKLAEHYANVGNPAAAAEQWVEAATNLGADDVEQAIEYCTMAIQSDPTSELAKQTLQAYAEAADSDHSVAVDINHGFEAVDTDVEILEDDDIVIDDGDVFETDNSPSAPPVSSVPPPPPVASHSAQPAQDTTPPSLPSNAPGPATEVPEELTEGLDELEFYMAQGMEEEARDTLEDMQETFPDHPALLLKARQLGLLQASVPATAPSIAPEQKEPPAQLAAPTIPPQPRPLDRASDPSAALAELPLDLPAKTPNFAAPQASTLPALDGLPGVTSAAQPPSSTPPEDQSFAFAEKLAGEVEQEATANHGTGPSGAETVEVGAVIEQFRAGVRAAVDPSDSDTHYDLGIAYMEMSLHDEAIEEFKLCLSDADQRCRALTMIGLSHVSKGDMHPALQHFSDALACTPTEAEQLELRFEMGNAYELIGKANEALMQYELVEENDPNYRNVAQRIERLGIPQTATEEDDEFDTMFDNMILKD